jgi:hypothetical protein
MNPSRTTPPFVKRADSDHIVVHVQEDALSVQLESLGFTRVSTADRKLQIETTSKEEKARVLTTLRDRGFIFLAVGSGAPRKSLNGCGIKSLVSEVFSEIYWVNPHSWLTRDNQ